MEDGAQVLGIHPADKYAVSMEHLASALAAVCRSRPLALRAILQQVVLAWATGNGDLHAKNLSVVGSADRTVAPIYDIPSTVPYGDTTFALSVAGRRDNLTAKALTHVGGGTSSGCWRDGVETWAAGLGETNQTTRRTVLTVPGT